ncbi:MAG: hypothetical protein HQK53_14995 [Oligoflexia bacterium]|nr:hypothetical protein [Oligoflexia bacterium]
MTRKTRKNNDNKLTKIIKLLSICSVYCFFFFSLSLFVPIKFVQALDYRESITAIVIGVSENGRQFIIDRGGEEGVLVGDVGRIWPAKNEEEAGNAQDAENAGEASEAGINSKKEEDPLFSAVAVHVRHDRSEWVIHNNYQEKPLQKNDTIRILSLYGTQRPRIENLEYWQKRSILKAEIDEEKQEFLEKQKKKVEDVRGILYKKYYLRTYKEFPWPSMGISLNVSPVTYRLPSHDRTLSYGIDVKNLNQEKYIYNGDYYYSGITNTYNIITREQYSSSNSRSNHTFDIKELWDPLDYTSLLQYKKERVGTVYTTRYQIDIGPLGIKYSFPKLVPTSSLKSLSISYIPLLEFFSSDDRNNNFTPPLGAKDIYWRHCLTLSTAINLNNRWSIEEKFTWRPYHSLPGTKLDLRNTDLRNTLAVRFEIYPQLAISYISTFTQDIRRKNILQIPASEWENSFYISYILQLKTDT